MVKVIFLENIEEHKVGDVKKVADGYARNFLIPRGIAKMATEAEVKNLESKIKKIKEEEKKKVEEAEKTATKIKSAKIKISEEVNEEGHLYGAVSAKEISAALEEKGLKVDASEIVIEEPIKELGEYEIIVKAGHGVETSLKIKIERKE